MDGQFACYSEYSANVQGSRLLWSRRKYLEEQARRSRPILMQQIVQGTSLSHAAKFCGQRPEMSLGLGVLVRTNQGLCEQGRGMPSA